MLAVAIFPLSAWPAEVSPPPVPTPAFTPSAVTLALPEAIRKALAVAPSLVSAQADREIAEGRLSEAKSAYLLPQLKLRVVGGVVPDVPQGSGPEANFPDVNADLTQLGYFIQTRVEALQPVFTFGKLAGYRKAAQHGVEAKTLQRDVAEHEVIANVKKVYFGLVFLESLQSFMDELTERANSARERVDEQLRKHNPDVTDIDLMRLDVFSAETDRRTVEVGNGVALGRMTLGILTGGLGAKAVEVAEKSITFREVEIKPAEYYLSLARAARPELRQLAEAVAARKSLADASKADFFPQFFLGGYYGYGHAPGREHVDNPFLRDDFNYSSGGVALGFEQNLGFHLTNSRHRQAEAEYRKMLADRSQAEIGIDLEIRKAWSDALTKRDAVLSARKGFKAGRSWVTATTLNFGVGLVPVKDLLEAFVGYSRVKAGFFDTLRDYEFGLAELSRVVGEEVGDLKY